MRICRAVPPETPAHAGLVETLRAPPSVEAVIVDGNPLADRARVTAAVAAAPAPRVVMWSGTLGGNLFDAHPPNWLAPGRAALDRFCADLAPAARAAGKTVCFRPHCRHVLSDAPSFLAFLRDHAGEPVDIALCPGSMFEPSMLDAVEDHLERLFEMLGPKAAICFLNDVVPDPASGLCRPVPLGRGVLPPGCVRDLVDRFVPPQTPIVLLPEAIDEQRAWLGLAGCEAAADRLQ